MFDKGELLYVRLARDLCLEILSNSNPCGMKVPSVREFSSAKKVNSNTVQKAYKYLDELGIFISEAGLGRYVTNDSEKIASVKRDLVEVELNKLKKIATKFDVSDDEIIKWYQEISDL